MSHFCKSWVEKYRPQNMDDICSQDHIIQILKKSIKSNTIPHLLFYGSSGTGKTSTIITFAKQIYGENNLKNNVMVLNASDERGIGIVRNKVKTFAQTSVDNQTDCAKFKLIVLDEADSMTTDAQAALRRIIEDYSHITRFCMICNYVSKIIDPLVSRCIKFYFKPITDSNTKAYLNMICEKEQIRICPKTVDMIINISNGDLRRAVSLMEISYKVHGDCLGIDNIMDYAGIAPANITQMLVKSINNDNLSSMNETIQYIIKNGFPIHSALQQIAIKIIDSDISEELKKKFGWAISNAIESLNNGANEYIQITYLCSFIKLQLENKNIMI